MTGSGRRQHVHHHGRSTAYRFIQGDEAGPTTLYIHGSGADHRIWVHQYAPAGPLHPAAALDLSGHGASTDIDTPAGPATLAAYAEDVQAVVKTTGAEVIVGHSLGGAVLFRTLLDSLVEPAAVIFAGTGAKLAVHESIRTQLRTDFEAFTTSICESGGLVCDSDSIPQADPTETLFSAGQAVTLRDFMSCHTFDVRDELADIDVPALAIAGDADALTPPQYHEYLAAHLPDCSYVELANVGHLAMLEAPDRFNAALESFVTDRGLHAE